MRSESERPRPRRRRGVRWAVAATAVLVVAVAVLAGLAVRDGLALREAAADLEAGARAAQADLRDRDVDAFREHATQVEDAAARFVAATDGPHWWLAARTVYLRDQVRPLIAAGGAVDLVATEALTPLAQLDDLAALTTPVFDDGRVDPDILEPYRPTLARAASAVDQAVADLAAQDLSRTDPRVAEPFSELSAQLEELDGTLGAAHLTAQLLPTMLGGEAPRTYLVMVQNNAESRTTGGIPGAVLELTVDDGRLVLAGYRSATEMIDRDGVAALTADEEVWYGPRMAWFPQNVNLTPSFPRSAELLTEFWKAAGGSPADGVISTDPVALGWMLEGTPPVEIDGVTLEPSTLAGTLLNEAYLRFPEPEDQDQFFARAAARLFQQMVAGAPGLVDGVTRAAGTGRFLMWTPHEDEQALLATTPLAGDFLAREDALGVFLNDGSGTKIGWYVDTRIAVTDRRCADGALAGQTVRVSFDHTFTGDPEALPETVGGGEILPFGRYESNLMLMPPTGMTLTSASETGRALGVSDATYEGREVIPVRVDLDPGEAVDYVFELDAETPLEGEAPLMATPGPRDGDVTRDEAAAEGC